MSIYGVAQQVGNCPLGTHTVVSDKMVVCNLLFLNEITCMQARVPEASIDVIVGLPTKVMHKYDWLDNNTHTMHREYVINTNYTNTSNYRVVKVLPDTGSTPSNFES